MKKKMLISLVACFIAAGSFVHYNLAQNYHNMDVSLADISVMAQADGESGYSCSATTYCYDLFGTKVGEVSCTGVVECKRGRTWVECDGNRTYC